MPKSKFELTKKHRKLVDIVCAIPTVQEIGTRFYLPSTALADHKGNTINSLMQALQVITKDTQYEEICNEIIKKSQDVLEYCERNSN